MITREELLTNLKRINDLNTMSDSGSESDNQVNESLYDYLMSLTAEEFLKASYHFLLKREIDIKSKNYYLIKLKNGELSRQDILTRIKYSPEGIKKKAQIDKINLFNLLLQLPILGYVIKFFIFIFNPFSIIKQLNLLNYNQIELIHNIKNQQQNFNKIQNSLSQKSLKIEDIENQLQKTRNQFNEVIVTEIENKYNKIKTELLDEYSKVIITEIENKYNKIKTELQNNISNIQEQSINIQYQAINNEIKTLKRSLYDIEKRINSLIVKKGKPKLEIRSKIHPSTDNLYIIFEDKFRGTREEIKNRLKVYIPIIEEYSSPKCLDLGCGRGEWLELLKEKGYSGLGIDKNPLLKYIAEEYNLNVKYDDVFSFLKEVKPDSYHIVTAFHLIEHLPFNLQVHLLDEIYRILLPGGTAIIESPNPRNILVSASDFYRDPDHLRPVFPDTLQLIATERGFNFSKCYFIQNNNLISIDDYSFNTLEDYINVSRDFAWIGKK